jgi:hypothetical protein
MSGVNSKNKVTGLLAALSTLVCCCAPIAPALASALDLPPESLKVPELQSEEQVSTYVPSLTAQGKGLAVSLSFTKKARYADGAPVAVVVPGGTGADGLNFNMHASQAGLIEIRFAFPGGGSEAFGSEGKFDNRGALSAQALRDVILFAAGKRLDYKGRSFQELLSSTGSKLKVLTNNLGLIGWDQGGNTLLVTLGKYAQELKSVGWLAFYESPVGSLFTPATLGCVQDLQLNKHYREGSAATGNLLIDYRKLAWQPSAFRNPNRLSGKRKGTPGLKGVLYFDENKNGVWEESREFAFSSSLDSSLAKQYFPPQVSAACERTGVFGEDWPENVATVSESEEFFASRDGSLYIEEVARQFPKLLVGVFASQVDHGQQQQDHPHITFLYNLFLTHKVKWLRLNPDPVYMTAVSSMNPANFVNNKPNSPIDPTSLVLHLEPEGVCPDYVFMQALIAEMADRLKTRNLVYPLVTPLITFDPQIKELKKP